MCDKAFSFWKGEDMAKAEPFDDLTKSDALLKRFWSGTNGNNLINFLNTHNHSKHKNKLRREKWPPVAYGLVLNGDSYNGTNPRKTNFKKKQDLHNDENRIYTMLNRLSREKQDEADQRWVQCW